MLSIDRLCPPAIFDPVAGAEISPCNPICEMHRRTCDVGFAERDDVTEGMEGLVDNDVVVGAVPGIDVALDKDDLGRSVRCDEARSEADGWSVGDGGISA